MENNFLSIKTWVFDCDGVLLDSNRLKTEAFRELAEKYAPEHVESFVNFHRQNGGVSRFAKFEMLFREILKEKNYQKRVQEAVEAYGNLVSLKLLSCKENEGLREFLEKIPKGSTRYVISGGLESEVQNVLKEKNLAHYFTGIYGSPRNKMEILTQIKKETGNNFGSSACFVGDSTVDYETAKNFGMNFIFLYGLTEFEKWSDFFGKKPVLCSKDFRDLLHYFRRTEKIAFTTL